MPDDKPKRGMDWVTPPPKPNIKDLLVLIYGEDRRFEDDDIRHALQELLDLRARTPPTVMVEIKGPPSGTPLC